MTTILGDVSANRSVRDCSLGHLLAADIDLAFDGRWNVLVNADEKGAELYDLSEDASETNNIAGDHADNAARLKDAALKWR
jgi:hypothetical protein